MTWRTGAFAVTEINDTLCWLQRHRVYIPDFDHSLLKNDSELENKKASYANFNRVKMNRGEYTKANEAGAPTVNSADKSRQKLRRCRDNH